MNRLVTIAKVVFSATFVILWIVLLLDQKFAPLAVFVVIFVVGFFVQGKTYFWKACVIFFGVMSIVSLFGIFGGLEPNSQGVLATGNWFGLKLPLFLMLTSSTVLSFLAGLRSEEKRPSIGN